DVEMVTLFDRQSQGARQGREHLRRGIGGAALFETDQVVDRNVGQQGELFPAQAAGPPGQGRRKADVGRLDPVTPGLDVGPDSAASPHPYSLPQAGGWWVVPAVPGSGGSWMPADGG